MLRFLLPSAGSVGGAGGSRAFGVGLPVGGETLRTLDASRRPQGDAKLDDEAATTVVIGAQYLPRSANDDGARCAVISPALGGAFFYDRDEAARRIRVNFPKLDEKQVFSAVALMQSRVRLALNPPENARRDGWINSWREARPSLPWE